jgi:hypothetical protein
MESLSDFLSRNRPPESNGPSRGKSSFMNMRQPDPNDGSILVLHATDEVQSNSEHAIDRLVGGLIDLLPKPDSVWRHEDRVKWLRLAADIFEVGYKADDSGVDRISIVTVKPERHQRLSPST